MRFVDLLNSYVERISESKNGLIEKTGIDRSTFFKILSGKRLPTRTQLYEITKILPIADSEKNELMDAYEREAIGDGAFFGHKFVEQSVKIIAESDNELKIPDIRFDSVPEIDLKTKVYSGFSAVQTMVELVIMKELLDVRKQIDMFIPISIMDKLNLFQTFRLLGADENVRSVPIRQLIEFPVGNIFYDSSVSEILSRYLKFILSQKLNYNAYCYYANYDIKTRSGVFYPFYIITSEYVLLLSKDCDNLVIIDDSDICENMNDNFSRLVYDSTPMISGFDSKEEYVKLLSARGDKTLYIIERRPGVSFLMTEEFMDKFIPKEIQPEIRAHVNCFTSSSYVEIISPDGVNEFENDCIIDEAGFKLSASSEDVEKAIQLLKYRIHDTLEVADPDLFPFSKNWSISVVEDEYLILVPYLNLDKIICLSEKNIVNSFASYIKNMKDKGLLFNDIYGVNRYND